MTIEEAAILILIMLGGSVTLIAAIIAGSVAISFLFHAEPIVENGESQSDSAEL